MERTYTDEELENIDRPPCEFEGRTYTEYEATQKQRQIERTIRKLKREQAAFEAAGLEDDAKAVRARIRRLNAKYKDFSAAADLPMQRERTRVLGSSVSAKAPIQKGLEEAAGYGILKESGPAAIKITQETIDNLPKVDFPGTSKKVSASLQQQYKELLETAMKEPTGTEVGFVCDMTGARRAVAIGTRHSVRIPKVDYDCIVLHNHPDGMIFSEADIERFIFNSRIKGVAAVGNNGAIYIMAKADAYDGMLAHRVLSNVKNDLEQFVSAGDFDGYVEKMQEILKEGKAYGVEFVQRGPRKT